MEAVKQLIIKYNCMNTHNNCNLDKFPINEGKGPVK